MTRLPNDSIDRQFSRRDAIKFASLGFAGVAGSQLFAPAGAAESGPGPTAAPLQTEFVFEALVTIAAAVEVGPSDYGTRRYIPITGGTFAGPNFKGTVLAGGADWQLERPDGVTELDAHYSVKTDDGAVIIVHNHGIASNGWKYLRTVPRFEAPNGPYDWLNKAVFVGAVAGAPVPNAVIIRVFRVI